MLLADRRDGKQPFAWRVEQVGRLVADGRVGIAVETLEPAGRITLGQRLGSQPVLQFVRIAGGVPLASH
jgi:hypothetical protein